MQLRLDPWATEYNTAYLAEEVSPLGKDNVDIGVETQAWQKIRPQKPAELYEALLFLDGTQRSEARVLLEDERQQLAFGAIGSFAVGAVNCCPRGSRQASYLELAHLNFDSLHRICVLSGGHSLEAFSLASDKLQQLGKLDYRIVSTEKREADAVLRQIQFEMLKAEGLLASRLCDTYREALVISDGPLPRSGYIDNVVGYVKTIHQVPIPQSEMELVRALEQGERSPLYLVSAQDKSQQHFECFLRLRDPRPWLYSLAGMIRLQIFASSQPQDRLETAISMADWLCHILPGFASLQHQDPRAPQQLLPIRALESELRRKMGDARLIRRRITAYLSRFS